MNIKESKGSQKQNLREKDIIQLPTGKYFLKLFSMTIKKLKKGFRGTSGQIDTVSAESKKDTAESGSYLKSIFQRDKPTFKKEEEEITKPSRPRLKKKLRAIREKHTSPRPDITLFHLERGKFFAYSTSENEETRDETFFSALAATDSGGRNIVRALTSITDSLESFSLDGSEFFSFLPVKDEILCFGRIKPSWLFLLRSRKFSKERLLPPEESEGTAYSFNGVKLLIDSKLDLLLKARGKKEKEEVYPELAESLRLASRSLMTNQSLKDVKGREQNLALYLLHTPKSRLSSFLLIQLEMREKVRARIFPIWFNYLENKLINTAKEIKKTYNSLPS